MKDAYNVAVNYLRQKYNLKSLPYYNSREVFTTHDDTELFLLIEQYSSLSIEPKKELKRKLTRMNIPFEDN